MYLNNSNNDDDDDDDDDDDKEGGTKIPWNGTQFQKSQNVFPFWLVPSLHVFRTSVAESDHDVFRPRETDKNHVNSNENSHR
jgi:hypothetical protein